MSDPGNPIAGGGHALDITDTAIGHPYTPLADIISVVRDIHPVHHLIFVAIEIDIAETADIVDLRHSLCPECIRVDEPCVLMHEVLDKAVCYIRVDGFGVFIPDGVLHTTEHGVGSDGSAVAMRPGSALFLHIPAAIEGIGEVGETGVHHRIDLLHTPLLAVIVEVCPRHICYGTAACYARAEFLTNYDCKYSLKSGPVAH